MITAKLARTNAILFASAAALYAGAAVLYMVATIHPELQLLLAGTSLILVLAAVASELTCRRIRSDPLERAT